MPCSRRVAAAVSIPSPVVTVTSGVDMQSATVVPSSGRSSTTSARTSESVTMPTGSPPSTTTTEPTSASCRRRTTARADAVGATVSTFRRITSPTETSKRLVRSVPRPPSVGLEDIPTLRPADT
jgi:hypothetical protein